MSPRLSNILVKYANSRYFEVVLILFLFIISFISFKYFFSNTESGGYYQNVISALLGTLFTVVITSFLLKKQINSEEIKEQSVEVFKKRIEKYENLIHLLTDTVQDNKISKAEAVKLKKAIYEISLFCGKDTLVLITNFIKQEIIGEINEEERVTLLDITSKMREELRLEGIESFDKQDINPLETLINSGFEVLPLYKEISLFLIHVREEIEKSIDNMEEDIFHLSVIEHVGNCITFFVKKNETNELDFYSIQIEYPNVVSQEIELEFSFIGQSGRFHCKKDEEMFLEASKIGVEYILDEEEPKSINGIKSHTLFIDSSKKIKNNASSLGNIIFKDIVDTEKIICKYKN